MGIHDGHRERLQQHFREKGIDGFTTVTTLEFLLQFAIPRRDTNPIAHALLDKFGSLHGVFSAKAEELCDVPGVGPRVADLITLIPQIMRKSAVDSAAERDRLPDRDAVIAYLQPRFLYEQEEIAILLCLDPQQRVIKCVEVARGVVDGVKLDIRQILVLALEMKSSSVVLAHNHPDGPKYNSREDDMATRELLRVLHTVSIYFQDHLIFTPEGCFSYRGSGTMDMLRY